MKLHFTKKKLNEVKTMKFFLDILKKRKKRSHVSRVTLQGRAGNMVREQEAQGQKKK
jgi:hypothetical protein